MPIFIAIYVFFVRTKHIHCFSNRNPFFLSPSLGFQFLPKEWLSEMKVEANSKVLPSLTKDPMFACFANRLAVRIIFALISQTLRSLREHWLQKKQKKYNDSDCRQSKIWFQSQNWNLNLKFVALTSRVCAQQQLQQRLCVSLLSRLQQIRVERHLPGAYQISSSKLCHWTNHSLQSCRHLNHICLN